MKLANLQYKLQDLVEDLDVTIKGDANCLITGVSPIQKAQPGHITFLTNSLYKKHLSETKASAVILSEKEAASCPVNAVISQNPHYIYAKIAAFFAQNKCVQLGIHPTASIGENCEIDPLASIGPYSVIGNQVKIAAHTVIGAHCVIGDSVEIGEETKLDARVTLYAKVRVGKRTHISSGVVIGSDGFGFAKHNHTWHKVPQLGSVEIGDDVDIGANTTIDCGAVENTIIGNGVKLDNLIQVGHNVQIGENTIIAGCTGIAGSTTIGKNCMIGGASCINGHITITDSVMITGMTGIAKSIHEPGVYSSGVGGTCTHQEWRKNTARLNLLDKFIERIKALEITVKELTKEK